MFHLMRASSDCPILEWLHRSRSRFDVEDAFSFFEIVSLFETDRQIVQYSKIKVLPFLFNSGEFMHSKKNGKLPLKACTSWKS